MAVKGQLTTDEKTASNQKVDERYQIYLNDTP